MKYIKVLVILINFVLLFSLWYFYYKNDFRGGFSFINRNVVKANKSKTAIYTNRHKEITMENLEGFGRKNYFPNGIPRIVHYNYKNELLPSKYINLVKGCVKINPTVLFVLWTDAAAVDLLKAYYPKLFEMYTTYINSKESLKKSDVLRYFILHYFGGIYMDLDTRCQRPFDQVMDMEGCILSQDSERLTNILLDRKFLIFNSLMACVPEHPFFQYILDGLTKDDHTNIAHKTGWFFLTKKYEKYNRNLHLKNVADKKFQVVLASSNQFISQINDNLEILCENLMVKGAVDICNEIAAYKEMERRLRSQAVTVHLFYKFGYRDFEFLITSRVKARTLEDVYIVVLIATSL